MGAGHATLFVISLLCFFLFYFCVFSYFCRFRGTCTTVLHKGFISFWAEDRENGTKIRQRMVLVQIYNSPIEIAGFELKISCNY